MINSPVTGVVITQVPVPVTTTDEEYAEYNRNDRRRGYDGHQAASGGGWQRGEAGAYPPPRPAEREDYSFT